MTYYKDLSNYTYHSDGIGENVLNIGWLEKGREFNLEKNSATSLKLVNQLWKTWENRCVRTRGFHECEFCDGQASPLKLRAPNGNICSIGSAEFRVLGRDGVVYAAPDMLLHYILEHNYQPPQDFVDSVLNIK